MHDTRSIVLKMNFNQRSSSRSSQISQVEVSNHKTHLILALPAWENLSSNYRYYYSSFAQELMNPLDNKVSLEIPLNTQMKIFAFLFSEDYNKPQLLSGEREVRYYGESQPFSIGTNTNNLSLGITLQTADTADGDDDGEEDTAGGGNQVITDNTAPTMSFSPPNGATGIAVYENITITFSEAVRNIDNIVLTDSSIDSHITLKLNNSSGNNINFDSTINGNKTVITINPTTSLPNSQVVYVAISATLEDSANNAITAANASFTTMALQSTVTTPPPLENAGSAYNASSNKYLVSTLGHLSYIAQNTSFWDKNFVQTTDIDATVTKYWDDADDNYDGDKYNDANDITDSGNNEGFSPIGNSSNYFTGEYDGNENTIHGLTIIRSSNLYDTGLFGRAQGSTISKLGLADVNLTGLDRVGPLAGLAYNTEISNCYAISGNVTGRSIVGGLVGYLLDASITNSYSNVDNVTSSSSHLGGLVGYFYSSSILNSYSTGKVIGSTNYRGGLVGTSVASSTVNDSFYDSTTSEQSDTGKGKGKSTADMKTLATFTDNSSADLNGSWDFYSTWKIDSSGTINEGYPYLE